MRTSPSGQQFQYSARVWILASVAAIAVLVTELAAEHFLHEFDHKELEIDVLQELSTVRAKLESIVNSNLLVVRGLSAVIAANPHMDQAQFARMAQGLVDKNHAIRNIAAAPDMVISLIYPLAGNEAALGLDYRTHPTQSKAAMRAVESEQLIVAGPLNLVQGGSGIIARTAVYIDPEDGVGPKKVWGLISSVVDVEALFNHAGLYDLDSPIRVAIRGVNATGRDGEVFFGSSDIFDITPVTLDVTLPYGSWHLAAMPKDGWDVMHTQIWAIRLAFLLIALLAGSAIYMRLKSQYEQAQAALTLSNSETLLRTLVETIPDLVWLKDPDGIYLSCNAKFERLFGAPMHEIVGKTDRDFVDAELAAFFHEKDQAAMAANKPSINEEWVTYANDGHRELLETIKTPTRDAAGQLLGVLGISRDITAHRKAETEANQRAAELEAVFQALPDLFFRMALDGTVLDYHAQKDSNLYVPPERLLGKRMQDALPPEVGQVFAVKLDKQLQGRGLVRFEYNLHIGGEEKTFEARLSGLPDRDEVIAIVRDITRRKRFEVALRTSEERLRLALKAANQGLYDLNLQTGAAIVNDEYARMIGYDPTHFHETNARWLERLHPDDRACVEDIFRRYVAGELPEYRVEFRQRMKSGDWLWILSLGRIVEWTKDGDPRRMLGTHTNISERKESEVALRHSETLFRTLASLSPVGVFRNDQQGNAVYVNARFAELVGLSEQACLGEGWVSRIHPADRDRLWQKWRAIVERGERFCLEYRFKHEDGEVIWVYGEAAAIQDDAGRPSGFVGALTDITQLKEAEAVMREANEELERRVLDRTTELRAANAELEAFTYAVSHDLRAPLRAIQGFQHALEHDFGDQLPEGAVDFLQEIRIGGKRMTELIDALLELSRSTCGEVSREPLELGALARDIHQRLQLMSPDRTVGLTIHGDLSAEGDLRLVKILLQNLLENAWKYTKNKKTPAIALYSLEKNDEKVFCIEDNGAGFDQAFATKLFEPFQRLHHQDEFSGVGIGLATVQRIIRRHGGWIQGMGEVGNGARFCFTLVSSKGS